jgi:hypothetical protein
MTTDTLPPLPEPDYPAEPGHCCGNYTTGAEYMGQREELCCGQFEEARPPTYTAATVRRLLAERDAEIAGLFADLAARDALLDQRRAEVAALREGADCWRRLTALTSAEIHAIYWRRQHGTPDEFVMLLIDAARAAGEKT